MTQHRKAPAYQEYASDTLISAAFRRMCPSARGLAWTMKLECWANGEGDLPSDATALAEVLGWDRSLLERDLPQALRMFRIDGERVRCPELDDYRAHVDDIRRKKSEGGKVGAAITNKSRPPGRPRVTRESPASKTRLLRREEPEPEPELERSGGESHQPRNTLSPANTLGPPHARETPGDEPVNAYLRASRGS